MENTIKTSGITGAIKLIRFNTGNMHLSIWVSSKPFTDHNTICSFATLETYKEFLNYLRQLGYSQPGSNQVTCTRKEVEEAFHNFTLMSMLNKDNIGLYISRKTYSFKRLRVVLVSCRKALRTIARLPWRFSILNR